MPAKTSEYLTDFSQPVTVSNALLAFPGAVRHLMPSFDAIPHEFNHHLAGPTKWVDVAHHWFGVGLPDNVEFDLKENIDGDKMIRHLSCILGSYQPKHQHKIAAVAFLLSQWCEDVRNWRRP